MYVYSGYCRLCEIGQPTGITGAGEQLHTGDIVLTYTENELGCWHVGAMSVVVSNQYQSYSDGTHVKKAGEPEFYVMGIRTVDLIEEPGEWRVKRIKSFEDVINGEHWREWGFSYRDV